MYGRMSEKKIWTAGLIVIGDEILSGRTQDKNVVALAKWLNVQGIRLVEVRIVRDALERIVAAVSEFAGRLNIRDADTLKQMQGIIAGMTGKRLRYRDLIADNGLVNGARS